MESIDFLDPDYKKKIRYNNHLKALTNFQKQMTQSEMKIVSEFFERKQINQKTKAFDNRTFLLDVAGSIRTLFRLAEFSKVEKDLKQIGFVLSIPHAHINKIGNEFRRRNRSKRPIVKSRSKRAVQVEYKRRK